MLCVVFCDVVKAGEFMCRRPMVAYFICENPEMVSRSLFADAQKYIFIVDG